MTPPRDSVRTTRRLQREVLRAVQQEQERLGQDLHDGLCQVLSGIKFQAGLLEQRLTATRHPLAKTAAKIETGLNEAIGQARAIARGLVPPELELGELGPSLQLLADCLRRDYDVRCSCRASTTPRVLDPEAASHLYRIAREACINAVKHAKPRLIRLDWKVRAGRFTLKVVNDGKFFAEPCAGHEGLGLQLMEYRARALDADLSIRPGPRAGCVVLCRGRLAGPSRARQTRISGKPVV